MKRHYTPTWAHLLLGLLRGCLLGFLFMLLIFFGLMGIYGFIYHAVAPDPKLLSLSGFPESTKIYSRDGQLLYEIYKEVKRTPVSLSNIALPLQQAFIAAEDKDFYNHPGISLQGILRSLALDSSGGGQVYGGSTITQQLVKIYIFPNQKTITRKISEAVWALTAEQNLSKQQILELYLNCVPFGRNTYGAEAAAESYFGKAAKNLDAAESAYLASLPNAPTLLSPDNGNRQDLEDRKNKILNLMLEQGYLTLPDYKKALVEKVNFLPATETVRAPHFVFWLKQQLLNKYGEQKVYEGGLQVTTTLDLNLQDIAEKIILDGATNNGKKFHAYNAALVSIDPKTGQVLALVGSKNYFGQAEPAGCTSGKDCLFEPFANVATSLRQPGSSFKPYVYATAFARKAALFPGSIILDAAKNFSAPGMAIYEPHNYNGQQYGRVPLRKALAGSLNIATVRLASQIGLDDIIQTAQAFGIKQTFSSCGLSLALGSCEISLLEHTGGIAGIANIGNFNPITAVLKVQDQTGKILEQYQVHPSQAIDPEAAFEVVNILKDDKARQFIFGPHAPLTLPDREVIAKTGTTQNWKDGWTLGATPNLAAGVWVGNNDGELMATKADGVFTAAPLWQKFMETADATLPIENFATPTGISLININSYTGKLAKPGESKSIEISADYAAVLIPPPPPKIPAVATSTAPIGPVPPPPPQPEDFPARIISQFDGEILPAMDLQVTAAAKTEDGTRASLFLDDNLIQSIPGPNFTWTIPGNTLTAGYHTLRVLAVNQAGYRSQQSIRIKIVY